MLEIAYCFVNGVLLNQCDFHNDLFEEVHRSLFDLLKIDLVHFKRQNFPDSVLQNIESIYKISDRMH